MKKHLFLLLLLLGFTLTSQNKNVNYNFSTGNLNSTFKSTLQDINVSQYKDFIETNNLSLYNKNTDSSDNYFLLGNRYVTSNVKSFSQGCLYCPKTDSFSPTGTPDFKSALGIGVINFLIDSF
jgi:hypothetical protein